MTHPVCPVCSKDFVKRVRREGINERLLGFFYVYPFKCQLCGHRFSSLQWGVRYIRIEEDRRDYQRIAISFPVSVAGRVDGDAIVIDLSMGGCTLSSDQNLAEGDLVTLALQIPNAALPIIVDAAVVRNVRANTAGIEFLRLQENERKRLQLFIRRLLISVRGRSSTEAEAQHPNPSPGWEGLPHQIQSR